MTQRIEAEINPQLLVWARKSVGMATSGVAKKLKTSEQKISDWERGIIKPSIPQLRKLARLYKRPIAIFFLPEPPLTFDAMKDFRKVFDVELLPQSPALFVEIRRAHYKREIALELANEINEEITPLTDSISSSDNNEVISDKVRKSLAIDIKKQFSWKDNYEAYNNWKEAIESKGVLVFQTIHTSRIKVGEMRGFSISQDKLPVIVINSKDSIRGKIFTLLHEFVHLLLRNAGICDLAIYEKPTTEEERVETFCNMIAGGVLVPTEILLREDVVLKQSSKESWSLDGLDFLSKKYSVSHEVILRRLLILNKTTQKFYEQKREEFLRHYKKLEEGTFEGAPPYYRLVIRNNGSNFIKLVLNAYYQEIINTSQLADYLGMKLKHLHKIENTIYGYTT
jgi:Zn-dependent peptidase ImmA (M78 family)/DNA-binding XRE family transcriptional regulator